MEQLLNYRNIEVTSFEMAAGFAKEILRLSILKQSNILSFLLLRFRPYQISKRPMQVGTLKKGLRSNCYICSIAKVVIRWYCTPEDTFFQVYKRELIPF